MPAWPISQPRRRFQFRLRTLMIVVTMFCVIGGYVAWHKKIVQLMITANQSTRWILFDRHERCRDLAVR
jgi:hypothetical protein